MSDVHPLKLAMREVIAAIEHDIGVEDHSALHLPAAEARYNEVLERHRKAFQVLVEECQRATDKLRALL